MCFEEIDRSATLEEISLLFMAIQQLGQVLANHTHGASYRYARELNELLYQARKRLDAMQAESQDMPQLMGVDEARFTAQFSG